MCRHLAYTGPPRTVADLVTCGAHSLRHQSWAPRDMRGGGTVNADGFGVCWWSAADGGRRPARHRTAAPVWADPALGTPAAAGALEQVRATAAIAAVRSATVGMPTGIGAVAPLCDGRLMLSHNGIVPGFPDAVADLADALPGRAVLAMEAPTDSALLLALIGADDRPLPQAVAAVVRRVGEAAPGARLNLLVGDGVRIVATTWGHALWLRRGSGQTWLASEPVDDDPAWTPVPDRHLVVVDPAGVTVQALAPAAETGPAEQEQ